MKYLVGNTYLKTSSTHIGCFRIDTELILRLTFIALYFGYFAVRIIPSRKSPTVKRDRSERWATLKAEGRLAIFSMIMSTYGNMIIVALYLLNVTWIRWSYLFLPIWIRFAGIILSLVSLIYLYWAGRVLAEHFSYTLEVQEEQKLITSGPYHRVRHPIYTGTLTFLIFQFLIADNWLFLALTLVLIPYLIVRVRKEEAMMIENFGEEYVSYMKRTGRFLPRL
ncbi:MAG: methyltransferase [Candidatus Thorarchaeota archaeon]